VCGQVWTVHCDRKCLFSGRSFPLGAAPVRHKDREVVLQLITANLLADGPRNLRHAQSHIDR
jgi:hypothetical protein